MSSPPMELSFYLSLRLLCSISIIEHSTVRPNSTFKYFNEGEFGEFLTEYRATFRPLDITESEVEIAEALCLGSQLRKPVRENTTLTFSADGKRMVIWRSMTPGETLFGKVLTRLLTPSWWVNVFELESPNSPKPYICYTFDWFSVEKGRLQYVTLNSSPNTDENFNDLLFELSTGSVTLLSRPNYNSTLSFLRLGIDGIYTFNDMVRSRSWEVTFTLFSREVARYLGERVPVSKIEDSFDIINSGTKPLAAYLFTNNKKLKQQFLMSVSARGVVINDTALHLAVHSLPFGGVGESGMGSYHGKFSFDAFTHKKACSCVSKFCRRCICEISAIHTGKAKVDEGFNHW
uniref:Aldehyde dehydrogenase domain-containing protein n=1 Tax=Salix viminalis TaxID=40686 RepID=A0A6N2NH38_SALVM